MTRTRGERRRVGLTRQGTAALGLTVLVALAAANTGANPLFLVLGLLCATLLFSWFAGRRVLSDLHVELGLPSLVEAGARFDATVLIRSKRPGTVPGIRIEGNPLFPEPGIYVDRLGLDGSLAVSYEAVAPARGLVQAVDLVLSTRAPFDLVYRRRRLEVSVSVAVHPRLLAACGPREIAFAPGANDSALAGEEGSLRNVRPYLPGDNPRRMHWRLTARMARPMVREHHAEIQPEVAIVVDSASPPGDPFEAALSAAASALRDALKAGYAVELWMPAGRQSLAGIHDLPRGLKRLAAIEAGQSPGTRGWDEGRTHSRRRIQRFPVPVPRSPSAA